MDGLLMTFLINDNLAWEIDHLSRLADQTVRVNVLFWVEQVNRRPKLFRVPGENSFGIPAR